MEESMTILEAMEKRHSVRSYLSKKIPEDIKEQLQNEIDNCNKQGGLHIQLVTDEIKAFSGFMAHYGKFSGVKNYLALIGKKSVKLEEMCGYYGEKIVLKAQQLGLNSCWVALTYKKVKSAFVIDDDERLCCLITLGYGIDNGATHKIKTIEQVSEVTGDMPSWFETGVKTALLAPTAMNQQKFKFILNDNTVKVKPGLGFYTKLDLGIVKYHFEIGAGTNNFIWQ